MLSQFIVDLPIECNHFFILHSDSLGTGAHKCLVQLCHFVKLDVKGRKCLCEEDGMYPKQPSALILCS